MSSEKIINIPESEGSFETESEMDYCLGCGLFRSVDFETGLCEDCAYKEREDDGF